MDEIEKDQFSNMKYNEEEKAKKIEDWNKDPQVHKNGIKAIDIEKSKVVTNNQYSWIKSFAFIGVLAFFHVLYQKLFLQHNFHNYDCVSYRPISHNLFEL